MKNKTFRIPSCPDAGDMDLEELLEYILEKPDKRVSDLCWALVTEHVIKLRVIIDNCTEYSSAGVFVYDEDHISGISVRDYDI